jgi:hypothetical protein
LYDEIGQCANRPAVGIQKVCSALIEACNIVPLSFFSRKIKTALGLLKEGLVHCEDTFSYDAFQFCIATSDLIHANAWIQKAWKIEITSCGEDSESAMKYKRCMKHLQTHLAWGFSPKMTLEGPDD